MAQTGGADTRRDNAAIDFHDHAATPQVQARCRMRLSAEHHERRGSIVCNRISEGDLPITNPAITDLEGGQDILSSGKNVEKARFALRQVLAKNERDLRLDSRLEKCLRVQASAVIDQRVVKDDSEVGLANSKLSLDGLRGEPDLTANDAPALCNPIPGVDRLHGVGAICVIGT